MTGLQIRQAVALLEGAPPPLPAQASAPIMVAVAAAYDVNLPVLLGPATERKVSRARFAAAALIRRRLGYSTERIGRLLRRDHTTIIHALRRAEALEREDPDFAAGMARAAATLDRKERA